MRMFMQIICSIGEITIIIVRNIHEQCECNRNIKYNRKKKNYKKNICNRIKKNNHNKNKFIRNNNCKINNDNNTSKKYHNFYNFLNNFLVKYN